MGGDVRASRIRKLVGDGPSEFNKGTAVISGLCHDTRQVSAKVKYLGTCQSLVTTDFRVDDIISGSDVFGTLLGRGVVEYLEGLPELISASRHLAIKMSEIYKLRVEIHQLVNSLWIPEMAVPTTPVIYKIGKTFTL